MERRSVRLFPRIVNVEDLSAEQRTELADRLFQIYSETVTGLDKADLESELFGSEGVRVALFYAPDGTLAGFSYAFIDQVSVRSREHAAFCAGVYFRLQYRGGIVAGLFGLSEALRYKLRHPFKPLGYLTRCASPAAYRLLATMPRLYPHRTRDMPDEIEALILTLCDRRGYQVVDERPLRARSVATPRAAGRLERLTGDADAQFYLQHVPDYADGRALLVFLPLDLSNVARGLVRLTLRGRRVSSGGQASSPTGGTPPAPGDLSSLAGSLIVPVQKGRTGRRRLFSK